MIGKINKSELLKKIQNLQPSDVKKLGLTNDEINFIKNRLLNDKLGLQLNFSEIDEKLEQNYLGLKDKGGGLSFNLKEKNNNLLIEGENYHALKALSIANVKVDIIYIDPPYNTGKEFIYNDNYTSLEKNNVVSKDDQFKHSKWLSFMKRRLKLAKELLKDDGVIFISIDDNEQAYLKVLMDEIFGEENFICNFIINSAPAGSQSSKNVALQHSYCISFSKDSTFFLFDNIKLTNSERDRKFIRKDSLGRYYTERLNKRGEGGLKTDQPNLHFPVWYDMNSQHIYIDEEFNESLMNSNIVKIIPYNSEGVLGRWTWSRENMIKNKNLLMCESVKDDWRLKKKIYETIESSSKSKSIIESNIARTELGTLELKSLMNNLNFNYPKPTLLIKYFLKLNRNKNAVVLDFFAGSGTTGQAVMELNQEDGGNRRFILVTNNENDIARKICYERLYRVINGISSNGESFDWEYSDSMKSLSNNSLRYLTIKEINKINGEYEDIDSMKQLYKDEFDKDISIKDFFNF